MNTTLNKNDIKFVYFYLTLKAAYRKHLSNGIIIMPGQCVISPDYFSKELNIHITKLENILNILEKAGKIIIKNYEDKLIITVNDAFKSYTS